MPDRERANFNKNVGDTAEVGKYSPQGDSPYGLADMAGNVWQWTADWFGDTYYIDSPLRNPLGPSSGQYRVLRGGGWGNISFYVRAALRGLSYPLVRVDVLGFRVAVCPCSVTCLKTTYIRPFQLNAPGPPPSYLLTLVISM